MICPDTTKVCLYKKIDGVNILKKDKKSFACELISLKMSFC